MSATTKNRLSGRTKILNFCRRFAGVVVAGAIFSTTSHAQGTGTVASPTIKEGAWLSVASGFAFDDGEEGYAGRIDYRYGVTDNLRLSAILFFNDRGGGDFRYRRLAVETMYQFASSKRGWNSAIQFRGRIPDGNDGPARVRTAWLNRWRPSDDWDFRLIGLASRQFGDERRDGFILETRAEATYRIGADTRFGAQVFNNYGSTADFPAFDDQRHSAGAVIKGPLTKNTSYRFNVLTGLSEAAPDVEIRLRLRIPV